LKGSFDGGWDKQLRTLRFANGSWIQVMTYEQDVDKFGGAALHFVGYDEPPPREIRDECLARLVDFGGFEMFAMTPLKANTGWIRRDIWKKREHPDVTVIKGSIHDNQFLDQAAKKRFLESLPSDLWRQAREFGDFVDVGGLIYADFERAVVDRYDAEFIVPLDHVVSIDPGIRNAAIIFGAFDRDNVAHIYDELLLQDKTPSDYAQAIRDRLEAWGVRFDGVLFVIDPAARARAQVNAESVETALAREGIYCAPGQNQVEAGVQQVRTRIQHGRLKVGRNCVGLRDEADEYAAEDRPDGEFKPIKENDHRLDALRYLVMARAWDPIMEEHAPNRMLGQFEFGEAPPAEVLAGAGPAADVPPMGFMS
jgi:phage terminase large subunit-like protein